MEFTNGRGDGFSYMTEAAKNDQEASKHPPLFPLSSSSLSLPTAAADNNFLTAKEHMFDKVVTPSDVGKLNRLVIPKQHAEKYFPLDTTANDKGLLLSFEDRTGKSWRFRYSYWNSSQSYVMTKGWSRFVKEKRLDAGDVVSFGRGVGESERDRFYIDWKRRLENHGLPKLWGGRFYNSLAAEYGHRRPGFRYNAMNGSATGGGDQYLFLSSSVAGPPEIGVQHCGGSGTTWPLVLNLQPLVRNQAAAKRVRLFGVNLECPKSESNDRTPRGLSASAPQLQSSCSKLLSFLPHESMQSWVASSSSIKEQNLTLDLGI